MSGADALLFFPGMTPRFTIRVWDRPRQDDLSRILGEPAPAAEPVADIEVDSDTDTELQFNHWGYELIPQKQLTAGMEQP